MPHYRICCLVALGIFLCSKSQAQEPLCHEGIGNFQAEFQSTGVALHAGATRNGELAARSCEASLTWDKHSLEVASGVPQIDVDAVGVDLGFGPPVTTLQIKQTDRDCCMEYRVYSLTKPPRLLRTIRGGQSFRSEDTDLDGQIEIWTDDSAAFAGFDGLILAELDSPPRIVLRASRGRLLDVTSEFQPYFDREIGHLRAEVNPDALRAFKGTDGRLSSDLGLAAEQMHQLRTTKVKVLEIVWSYLYSGREQQAWNSLAEMWPAKDVDRIRAAIVGARARGLGSQTDGVSVARPTRRKKRIAVFDATNESPIDKMDFTPPEPIMITRPAEADSGRNPYSSEALLNLVIDSAGKVRSAEPSGKMPVDPGLIRATSDWKFIPGRKAGRAMACQIRMAVGPRQ